ncbi:MAG: AAA family ATPase [Lautropia sp.]|nr:AAA family ATPase [Lautropia sp.]
MPKNASSRAPVHNIPVRQTFGLDTDLRVDAFVETSPLVPTVDTRYHFDPSVTMALLAGFQHNRRVLVQGLHGTGKSTHIEQVAARLNWPCMRVNLDGHISRLDLIGKDSILIEDGLQVTRFQEGIIPWALQQPMALILDEYDAGRPDVMFVIQRLLEKDGQFTLLEQNRVIDPHPAFRLFATANTVGQGNSSGLYHGVQRLNHAQLDRWNLVAQLNYLPADVEVAIIRAHAPQLGGEAGERLARQMVAMAAFTRQGFSQGDLSTLMSPRTVLTWAENLAFFPDPADAFRYSFLNKCELEERPVVAEYYQRCFDVELGESLMFDPLAGSLLP